MTHIAKSERGNNVMTLCGRIVSRGALGTALRKGRVPPYVWVRSDGDRNSRTIHSYASLCSRCVAVPGATENIDKWVTAQLAYMKDVHIVEEYVEDSVAEAHGTGVRMMCGMMWDVKSLFKNDIGYIEVRDLEKYINRPRFCKACTDHPFAQLKILAFTDL